MSARERSWPVPVALVALVAIPLTAGTLRLIQLAGGPAILPADHRFAGFPTPLVVHILGATVFALLGDPAVRAAVPAPAPGLAPSCRPRCWSCAGMVVAISALWLTLFYEAQPGTGALLYGFRLVFGPALAACLVLGLAAVRRGDIASHRAWMLRGYAIGLGAGTQVFTEGFGGALFGTGVVAGDLAKGAAWVINLAVAEWAIRRPARRRLALSTRREQAGALT